MYCTDGMENYNLYKNNSCRRQYNVSNERSKCERRWKRSENSPKLKSKRRLSLNIESATAEHLPKPRTEYVTLSSICGQRNSPDIPPSPLYKIRESANDTESPITNSIPEVIGVTSNSPVNFLSPAMHSYEYLIQRRLIDNDADPAEEAFEALDNSPSSSTSSSIRNSYEGSFEAVSSTPKRNTFRTGSLRMPKDPMEFNRRFEQKYRRRNSIDFSNPRFRNSSESSDELDGNANNIPSTPSKVLSSLSSLFPERGWFCKSCNKPKDECNCMCCIS